MTTAGPYVSVDSYGPINALLPDGSIDYAKNLATVKAAVAGSVALRCDLFFPGELGVVRVSRDGPSAAWSLDIAFDHVHIRGIRGISGLGHKPGLPPGITTLIRCTKRELHISDMILDGNWGNFVGGTDSQAGINQPTKSDPQNYVLWFYSGSQNCSAERVDIRQAYGDGVWIGGTGTRDILLRDLTIDMCARNGVSLAGGCESVVIEHVVCTNIYSTALDLEPGSLVKNVRVSNGCYFGLWWADHPTGTLKTSVSIQGSSIGGAGPRTHAIGFRLGDSEWEGCLLMSDAVDVKIDKCTGSVRGAQNWPPIVVFGYCDDYQITECNLYDSGNLPSANPYKGAISVATYAGGVNRYYSPQGGYVGRNKIRSRYGRDGIAVYGCGGKAGATGIASSVTALGFVASAGTTWIIDEYSGHRVYMGQAVATVVSNTADGQAVLHTLGWSDIWGKSVPPPPPGPFVICPNGGIVVVEGNDIDCVNDDGTAQGGYGIRLTAKDFPNMRVRCHRNNIRGATTSAIYVDSPANPPNGFTLLELTENLAWDNQLAPTCHNVIEFKTPTRLGKLVIRGNLRGEGVAVDVLGLTSGVWLVNDGDPSEWAGFGSPESMVAAKRGSRYTRKDAGPVSYIKDTDAGVSGDPKTGWIPS
jgi:hypothetical protein